MPGIVGFAGGAFRAESPDERLARMAAHLRPAVAAPAFVYRDRQANVSLGSQGWPESPREAQLAANQDIVLAFIGELFDSKRGGSLEFPAQKLLDVYSTRGSRGLADLEGRFAAAVWSASKGKLTLLSDKFGTKPLYYSLNSGELVFATKINSIREVLEEDATWNPHGLVQFFTFGHLWNRDTFWASIDCMDAATELAYYVDQGKVAFERYWRPSKPGRQQSRKESLARITDCLFTAVDEQCSGATHLGVSLSGGLDARTILALASPKSTPYCVSLGIEGSLDLSSSKQLAIMAKAPWTQLSLDKEFLAHFPAHFQTMLELTDGHYLSQCIILPTLPLYQRLGIRKLLRGHAGELLHMQKAYNFSMDSSAAAIQDDRSLEEWLWTALQSHLLSGVEEPVLRNMTQQEFCASGRRTLQTALEATKHLDSPLEKISLLFLDQRTRRETAMSISKFDAYVDTRMPYLDGRLMEAVFAAPSSLKLGEEIQAHAMRMYNPAFLRPANSNTGAPVGANAFTRAFCYYRMKVLAKLGVKGFQPYERLGLWLRQELRPWVESVLLSAECLDGPILNPDCIRKSVRRHMSGEKNHTFLLMAFLVLQLGSRRKALNSAAMSALPVPSVPSAMH